jgi:hypothetical protein
VDNQLDYFDQAAFLSLRALGRETLQQAMWIYDHGVDMEGLRRFHRNLGQGLLGRRIERSPLPFGRHRWVAAPDQHNFSIATTARPRSDLGAWLDEQAAVRIDPERGPSWRLSVLPLEDGGTAVTMVVSHMVADGAASILSALLAVKGMTWDLGYPPPGSRARGRALREDFAALRRSAPDMARAVKAAVRLAREDTEELRSSAERTTAATSQQQQPVIVPSVCAFVDIPEWDQRAASLGGTPNALLTGLAARIGKLRGRVDSAGQVMLQLPVSQRTESDTRANALTGVSVMAQPDEVTTTLTGIRAAVKEALIGRGDEQHKLLATVPLTPLTPKRVARKLHGLAMGVGRPVGCSNVGDADPDVNRPDGTDADFFWARTVEWPITPGELDHMGGLLMIGSLRIHGKVVVSVMNWEPGSVNTREKLRETIEAAIADFGLTATLM